MVPTFKVTIFLLGITKVFVRRSRGQRVRFSILSVSLVDVICIQPIDVFHASDVNHVSINMQVTIVVSPPIGRIMKHLLLGSCNSESRRVVVEGRSDMRKKKAEGE